MITTTTGRDDNGDNDNDMSRIKDYNNADNRYSTCTAEGRKVMRDIWGRGRTPPPQTLPGAPSLHAQGQSESRKLCPDGINLYPDIEVIGNYVTAKKYFFYFTHRDLLWL